MDGTEFSEKVKSLLRSISMNHMKHINKSLQPYKVSSTQAVILRNLSINGKMRISEISQMTSMPPSNISAICKRLEQGALIERIRDTKDARSVYIILTKSGAILCAKLRKDMECATAEMLDGINEAERAIIISGLEKLNDVLSRQNKY